MSALYRYPDIRIWYTHIAYPFRWNLLSTFTHLEIILRYSPLTYKKYMSQHFSTLNRCTTFATGQNFTRRYNAFISSIQQKNFSKMSEKEIQGSFAFGD